MTLLKFKKGVLDRNISLTEIIELLSDKKRFDLSLKQELPLDGLEIFLNASNLTETSDISRYRGVTSGGDNFKLKQFYGRTIDLGLRYAF